jgi:trehalose 6-phosphate synthase
VLHGQTQIIGVDRLDYTKGLPERFRAFERLLEKYPENIGRVTLMQIAPTSRTDVEDYVDLRHELEGISGNVNGRFGEFDWTPIRYISRSFSRTALAGLYRASKVGLVTPLRDGMNLVAKEYVAAQDPDDPGTLVLSRFTGAVMQLEKAVIVNPFDTEGVADALQGALRMPHEERIDRWRSMMDCLRSENVDKWRGDYLRALRGG